MKTPLFVLLAVAALTSCQFSKSVQKDFLTGVSVSGDGITCEDVSITVNDEKVNRNSFTFGEKYRLVYSGVEGFALENNNAFPGLTLVIVSPDGDTLMQTEDLYASYSNGIDLNTTQMTAYVVVATPMHSGNEYILYVNIWDKKGDGTLNTKFPFKVVANENLTVTANKLTYTEIYAYSENDDAVITGSRIGYNNNIYAIIEGLRGFTEENGMVFPGLSMKAADKDGNKLLDYEDLFADYSVTGIAATDIAERISPQFILSGSGISNPFHFELVIWDKKSDARLTVTTDFTVE